MLRRGRKGHGGLATLVAGATVGISALLVGTAAPAWAAGSLSGPTGGNAASANQFVVAGGAQATYSMMVGLANLFNASPGCDLATASGATQPLDYGCPGVNDSGGSLSSTNNPSNSDIAGQDGFTPFATENPFNDVLVNEPALGSSNGIAQLEKQATHAPATTVTIPDVTVTASSNTITATGTGASVFTSALNGDYVSGTDQGIPSGTTATYVSSTSITLSNTVLATVTTGAYSVTFSTSQSGTNVAPITIARDSRAPNITGQPSGSTGDDKGLNFVAYAMDGVSWLHWTEVGSTATPSADVSTITTADLTAIWENNLTCSVGGTSYSENWICLGGQNAPIALYIAQSGAGTESTWATLLGLTGTFPYGGEASSHIIFEDETESITNNGDEADAIFFFSYGNYNATCTPAEGYCGSKPASFTGTNTLALGEINGVPVNQGTISAQLPNFAAPTVSNVTTTSGGKKIKLASGSFPATVGAGDAVTGTDIPADTVVTSVVNDHKIKLSNAATGSDSSDSLTFTPQPFPGDRLLYNVYSDGANPDIPVSSLAALNVVSEDGFLCKPSTGTDIDPNTGASYRSEIDSVIESNGFYPLPLEVETGTYSLNGDTYGAASIANPAWTLPAVTSGPEVGGLGGSAYDNEVETGQPYNFPSADTDTDDSAVSGSYMINGSSVTATASAPVGYCLVLSTDSNGSN